MPRAATSITISPPPSREKAKAKGRARKSPASPAKESVVLVEEEDDDDESPPTTPVKASPPRSRTRATPGPVVSQRSIKDVLQGDSEHGAGGAPRKTRKARPTSSQMLRVAGDAGNDDDSSDDTFVDAGADDVGRVEEVAEASTSPTPTSPRRPRKRGGQQSEPSTPRRSRRLAAMAGALTASEDEAEPAEDATSAHRSRSPSPARSETAAVLSDSDAEETEVPCKGKGKGRVADSQAGPSKARHRATYKLVDEDEVDVKEELDDSELLLGLPGGLETPTTITFLSEECSPLPTPSPPPEAIRPPVNRLLDSFLYYVPLLIIAPYALLSVIEAMILAFDILVSLTGIGMEVVDTGYEAYHTTRRAGAHLVLHIQPWHDDIDNTIIPIWAEILHMCVGFMQVMAAFMHLLVPAALGMSGLRWYLRRGTAQPVL